LRHRLRREHFCAFSWPIHDRITSVSN
jgi:hypothetical protein